MDEGTDTFALDIPPQFRARRAQRPLARDSAQCRRDAHSAGVHRRRLRPEHRFRRGDRFPATLSLRGPAAGRSRVARPVQSQSRKSSGSAPSRALIDQITMLSVVLTGTALIREREHGTVEHLLVMPVTPIEIMMSKIWSMGLVVWVVGVPVADGGGAGRPCGADPRLDPAVHARHRAAALRHDRDGDALATLAESMPQFALLLILTLLPMQCCPARRRRGKACRRSFRTSCWPRPTPTSSCWRRRSCSAAPASTSSGPSSSRSWHRTALFAFALWRFRKVLK